MKIFSNTLQGGLKIKPEIYLRMENCYTGKKYISILLANPTFLTNRGSISHNYLGQKKTGKFEDVGKVVYSWIMEARVHIFLTVCHFHLVRHKVLGYHLYKSILKRMWDGFTSRMSYGISYKKMNGGEAFCQNDARIAWHKSEIHEGLKVYTIIIQFYIIFY